MSPSALHLPSRRAGFLLAAIFLLAALAFGTTTASAAGGPAWRVTAITTPTVLAAGDTTDLVVLTATNVGAGSTDGSPVTVADVLPPQLTAKEVFGTDVYREPASSAVSGNLSCTVSPAPSCTDSAPVDPGDQLIVKIQVSVEPGAPDTSAPNEALVSGGGAPGASAAPPISIGGPPPPYGFAPGGTMAAISSAQAGAHPNVTSQFALTTVNPKSNGLFAQPVATPRDIRFDLPPGLAGSVAKMPQCTMAQVLNSADCPADTMVGTLTATLALGEQTTLVVPVFNIAPAPGEPAAFGVDALYFPVRLDASLLSDGNYSVRFAARELTEAVPVLSTSVEIWGVPADHSGPGPDTNLFQGILGGSFGGPNSSQTRLALTTNPQRCGEPLTATASTDAWEASGLFASQSVSLGTLTGCEHLSLRSSLSVRPDTLAAGAPAGYAFDLGVPQETSADGLATPTVKRARVALPIGTVLSPSAASGLKACSNAQFFGSQGPRQEPAAPAQCPPESRIGDVQIKTPALAEPLSGQVYLGEPLCAPCSPQDVAQGAMVRVFVQASTAGEDPVIVKLEGRGQVNQPTGQITTTFEEAPQLPFEEFKLTTNGGPRAPLANPRSCGPASTTADLTPWSTPFTPDSTSSFSFEVNQGCIAPRFAPTFAAGTTNIQAGGSSPFDLSFARSDDDEFLSAIQTRLAPGLLASLANVPLCTEPQAAAGTCGNESLIGHVQALVGPGAQPFLIDGGRAFLTDGYKGAPFGLSIVMPTTAGPYTLAGTTGRGTVVVRAAINVDPRSAAVTITSDPIPTALDGIPLQVREVRAAVDRPGFIFNPTSCNRMAIGATLTSTEGASLTAASPFQVTNCATLKFAPKFSAGLKGGTKRGDHPALKGTVTYPYPSGPGYANIARAVIALPHSEFLAQNHIRTVCTRVQFAAGAGNGAECPAGSIYGQARAVTPLLDQPLAGPVYLRSSDNPLPDLVVALHGQVDIDLVGRIDSKNGGIRTSFESVPDAPVSKFVLSMSGGKKGLLVNSENICRKPQRAVADFTGQNGKVSDTTPLISNDCKSGKGKKNGRGHR